MILTQLDMDFIIRQQLTSDELPPWAGIVFKYPVDSDTLSEKLRAAYPDCKTLRERKHRAAIDFLKAELARMQLGNSIKDPITLDNLKISTQLAPDASQVPVEILSQGSVISTASGCTSPSIVESTFSPKLAEQTKKGSRAMVESEQSQPKASPTTAQQFVWSAHDGRSRYPKTKRKMTVAERSAYKETRKRGACDKCRRQKGRCTHYTDDNQWQPMVDFKRRSVDLDGPPQEGSKSIKLEYASDVHHESLKKQTLEHQQTMSINPESIYRTVGSPPNEQYDGELANEYVHSQNLISPFAIQTGKDQEPWSTFTTRDPSETVIPGYVLDPNVTQSLTSPQTPVYGFQPELAFYEGPWNANQNRPREFSPPE